MKKRIQYRQCTLRKRLSSGSSRVRVSFIPAALACVGKTVRLQNESDQWSDGWRVESVGAAIWSSDLPDSHNAIKRHRDATGDRLPRVVKLRK